MENAPSNRPSKNKWNSFKLFLKGILDIREDTDHEATIEEVTSGISIKGQGAWVLIFSILIASAGLNTSSTAVVIGAMLISPLMGPINGMGYSIAIYDMPLFRQALKNFSFAVFARVDDTWRAEAIFL